MATKNINIMRLILPKTLTVTAPLYAVSLLCALCLPPSSTHVHGLLTPAKISHRAAFLPTTEPLYSPNNVKSRSLIFGNRKAKTTALWAKKKDSVKDAMLAALDALDAQDDQPLSLKELKELEKKNAKPEHKAAALAALEKLKAEQEAPLSLKEQKSLEKKMKKETKKQDQPQPNGKHDPKAAARAALEALEGTEVLESPTSKKEAKLAEKMAKKDAKKGKKQVAEEEVDADEPESMNGRAAQKISAPPVFEEEEMVETPQEDEVTLEDRMRKERPPPRVRVMEGVQPGYVSLRLEDVAVTFRNQQVLKGVTWGVQSGDRVGLVGANGGGKTTQLRILDGEMEPTSGDVVKSSKDLRVAILRQEFVDELDMERSLFDEFMSVFKEENQVLQDLRDAETELESMAGADADKMQEVLDRMANRQAKADAKGVYALESRVQKVMDLMGFSSEEGGFPVKMFSGGWKMRIGLGKVRCGCCTGLLDLEKCLVLRAKDPSPFFHSILR